MKVVKISVDEFSQFYRQTDNLRDLLVFLLKLLDNAVQNYQAFQYFDSLFLLNREMG